MSGNQPNTVVADGLVSVTEACRFLDLSRATLYVLMDRGRLPYCKIGGARRIPRRALIELADGSLIPGTEPRNREG
jgi:excisionase family DNA binding protein